MQRFDRLTLNPLAKEIEAIHWDFQIETQGTNTTTDNGSNIVKAFK